MVLLGAKAGLSFARLALGEIPRPLAKGWSAQLYAWMAARMGNRELCHRLLGEMRDAAQVAKGTERDTAWRELIQTQIRLGEVDAALADMPQVVAPYMRYALLTEAAEGFASCGEMAKSHATFAEAIQAARPSEDNYLSVWGLVSVAEAAIRQGDMRAAREATELVLRELGSDIEGMRGQLAPLRLAIGNPVDLAEQQTKILAMRSSAATQETEGPEAVSSGNMIIARELVSLAAACAMQGQLDQTRKLVAEAKAVPTSEGMYLVAYDVERIPVAVAAHGNIRQAVALAEELLTEKGNRDAIMDTVAAQAVRQGKLDDALYCLTHFGNAPGGATSGQWRPATSGCSWSEVRRGIGSMLW